MCKEMYATLSDTYQIWFHEKQKRVQYYKSNENTESKQEGVFDPPCGKFSHENIIWTVCFFSITGKYYAGRGCSAATSIEPFLAKKGPYLILFYNIFQKTYINEKT